MICIFSSISSILAAFGSKQESVDAENDGIYHAIPVICSYEDESTDNGSEALKADQDAGSNSKVELQKSESNDESWKDKKEKAHKILDKLFKDRAKN